MELLVLIDGRHPFSSTLLVSCWVNSTVVTVFIAHFSRVIHSAEIDRLTAL